MLQFLSISFISSRKVKVLYLLVTVSNSVLESLAVSCALIFLVLSSAFCCCCYPFTYLTKKVLAGEKN